MISLNNRLAKLGLFRERTENWGHMADKENSEEQETGKGSRKPFLVGLVLALVLGGGGFYAVWSGMILAPAPHEEMAATEAPGADSPLPDVVFVPVPPLIINVGGGNLKRHLRFQAQLEVARKSEADVTMVLPRIVDVLNGYLRAIDPVELERTTALVRLRAQMLRRIQVVAGEGRVRDLLIMEFVLN